MRFLIEYLPTYLTGALLPAALLHLPLGSNSLPGSALCPAELGVHLDLPLLFSFPLGELLQPAWIPEQLHSLKENP
jgi:hypothetical protein